MSRSGRPGGDRGRYPPGPPRRRGPSPVHRRVVRLRRAADAVGPVGGLGRPDRPRRAGGPHRADPGHRFPGPGPAAAALSLLVLHRIPGTAAAPADVFGLALWFVLTARSDLAPPPER